MSVGTTKHQIGPKNAGNNFKDLPIHANKCISTYVLLEQPEYGFHFIYKYIIQVTVFHILVITKIIRNQNSFNMNTIDFGIR